MLPLETGPEGFQFSGGSGEFDQERFHVLPVRLLRHFGLLIPKQEDGPFELLSSRRQLTQGL